MFVQVLKFSNIRLCWIDDKAGVAFQHKHIPETWNSDTF